jgi:hypothetical protein|tara:strand:+ start:641 stop:979 length:339 start_codon:yes stop_codon:yes gene_type:complete
MAAIEFNGKEIYSRVLQAVPGLSENYVLNLINQGLIEIGQHSQKIEHAKADLVDTQMWYTLDDDRAVTINKVFRCAIKNDEGDYVIIPRLLPGSLKTFDVETTSVSTTFTEL